MERYRCVLCNSNDLKEVYRLDNMPVFMGVIDKENQDDIIYGNLIIDECNVCGNIQNMELLDLELVYMNNHNTDVVGETWLNHYIELNEFIKNNSIGDTILEIGDPSGKLANVLHDNYKKWIIVEPNPNIDSVGNIEIIKQFFTKDFKINDIIQTIVHSHVLEHIYDPVEFMKDSFEILEEDGCIIFSIPNIKWLLDNNALPTGVLHFEHTYYIDSDNIENYLNLAGFRLEKIYNYKNHSIFVKAIKDKNVNGFSIIKRDISSKLLSAVKYYDDKIEDIIERLNGSDFYLYSAHINSQYLLNNGIQTDNIISLLDISESKIGKKLYGFDLEVRNPISIENDDNPIVVISHMGAYKEEIKKNLLSINKNVILL
jgi:predicted SAM-dependent methyltransferase